MRASSGAWLHSGWVLGVIVVGKSQAVIVPVASSPAVRMKMAE
jgi:hypothetical protein